MVVSWCSSIKNKKKTVSQQRSWSKQPYLVRAMHEWISDNAHTPYIVVDALADSVHIPVEHIKNGKIVLNVSDSAAYNLKITNDAISFQARFSGTSFNVWFPMTSVLGIYARETGQGMIFEQNIEKAEKIEQPELKAEIEVENMRSYSHLTIVK